MITAAVYLGALRAHWRKLVALAALGLVLGVAASRLVSTEYSSSRLLVVTAHGGEGLSDLSQGNSLATGQAQALAYLGSTDAVKYQALSRLGLGPQSVTGVKLSASVPQNTSYVQIAASAPTEKLAVDLAGAAAEQLIADSPRIGATLGTGRASPVTVEDITATGGSSKAHPSSLPPWLLPLAGALLLPALAYFLLVLRSAIKPRVGESLDLDSLVPFPILGAIPRDRSRNPAVVRPQPAHFAVAARSGLMSTNASERIVALTSVEGPSDCRPALGLAQALAQVGRRVLVVDGDVARPSFPRKTEAREGFAEALANGHDARNDVSRWLDSSVDVLPTGQDAGATRLLLSERAHQVVKGLAEGRDTVLVISASALSGPDAAALADLSDEVILMADIRTQIDRIIDAGQRFRDGKITGLLVLDGGRTRSWITRLTDAFGSRRAAARRAGS